MIRVVLDTNQLVSAILTYKGPSAQIFNLFKHELIEVIISEPILREVYRVLNYPKIQKRHKWSSKEISDFVNNLSRYCIVVSFSISKNNTVIIKDDPTDDKYLYTAQAGNADYIITGDKHLLDLKFYKEIPIITPRHFLDL